MGEKSLCPQCENRMDAEKCRECMTRVWAFAEPPPHFKPRPEVEKKPGCFENTLSEPGALACLSCDVRDECRKKKWAEVEKP